MRPLPEGQFSPLPRALLESAAWRSAPINTFRVVFGLMLEDQRHGGRDNGKLKLPLWHMECYGVGRKYATEAIKDAERRGLIRVSRGGERVPSTYTLTWLHTHDGSPPTNDWLNFRDPHVSEYPPKRKLKILPVKKGAALPVKRGAETENLPVKCRADSGNLPPNRLRVKSSPLSREEAIQGGDSVYRTLSAVDAEDVPFPAAAAAIDAKPVEVIDPLHIDRAPEPRCLVMLPTASGVHRQCGRPVGRNGIFCHEHS